MGLSLLSGIEGLVIRPSWLSWAVTALPKVGSLFNSAVTTWPNRTAWALSDSPVAWYVA